ncbi:TPA: hypothetical protein QDB40_003520 [Burkholderia vietnamiensis]|nr:hypothetical protein [Burkholderia vietnamiensis]
MTTTTTAQPRKFDHWLTVQQFARFLNVSYPTAYQWFADDARHAQNAGLDTNWCCKPFDKKNWRIDPAWAAAFVPPSQRPRPSEPSCDNHPLASWLTLQQVADRFGVALITVRAWWRDREFDRPPPGEPESAWYRAPYGEATAYDRRLGGRLVNPAALDTFVPPAQRPRAAIAAAGLLPADEAAAFTGRSLPAVNLAAQLGELPFVLVDGQRAFDRTDLLAWRDLPTPTGRPRPPRSNERARNRAVRPGPLLSFSDAWRLLGFADRASVTRLVQTGRLPVVLDEQGNRRVKRADVEALAAERQAKKGKREAQAAA